MRGSLAGRGRSNWEEMRREEGNCRKREGRRREGECRRSCTNIETIRNIRLPLTVIIRSSTEDVTGEKREEPREERERRGRK